MKSALSETGAAFAWDEPMSRHTTLRVGGPADALASPMSVEQLVAMLQCCRRRQIPVSVLGSGSNLVVRDKGIRGVAIHLGQGFSGFSVEQPKPQGATIYAECGLGVPRLVDLTAEEGLSGLEPLAGIPGNLGGALTMNAGTPDGEVSDHLLAVTLIEKDGRLTTLPKEKIRFGYRESHFPRGAILLSARFELARSSPEAVRAKVREMREKRVKTQPLNVPNVGSVFKNPEGKFAGALIEEAGLKEVRVGGARISAKHANFIVNEEGRASAKDVIALIGLIRDKVKERFGILLEPEVRIVGEA